MSTCRDDGTFERGSKKTMDLAAGAEARSELLGDRKVLKAAGPSIDWGVS